MSDVPNRRFRSTFPKEISEDVGFRTGSWVFGKALRPSNVQPVHETLIAALIACQEAEKDVGITLLGERERHDPQFVPLRDYLGKAQRIASGLQALGIEAGDRVLIVLPTSHEFLYAFFGALWIGATPVPAYPPAGMRLEAGISRLSHIANQCEAKACVSWDMVLPVLGEVGLRAPTLQHIVTAEDLLKKKPLTDGYRVSPGHPGFIQYTSGSTGRPKGVVLTQDNLVCNIHSIGQAIEVNRNDVAVNWCPLYHDMGLIGALLFSFYWQLPLVLMSPTAFLARPYRWLKAISDYKGTLSTAPNFGYALAVRRVTEEQRAGLDLSSWRVALSGAEPVNLDTVRDFQQTYAAHGFNPKAFLPVYGLAEASLAVTFAKVGEPVRSLVVDRAALANGRAVVAEDGPGAMTVVSVGKALPGQSMMVTDERGQGLPDDEVGHIVAGGRSIMKGYFRNEKATMDVLWAGLLWTGDLGFIHEDNLYITGRAKDMIIVRGKNHYAEDLEIAAERISGVRGGGCVAFGIYDEKDAVDKVVLVAETKTTDPKQRQKLAELVAEAVQEECGVEVDDVLIVDPGTIPKTSSGKRQRNLCRKQFLEGSLRAVDQSSFRLGLVYVRSQVGYLLMKARKLIRNYREPE